MGPDAMSCHAECTARPPASLALIISWAALSTAPLKAERGSGGLAGAVSAGLLCLICTPEMRGQLDMGTRKGAVISLHHPPVCAVGVRTYFRPDRLPNSSQDGSFVSSWHRPAVRMLSVSTFLPLSLHSSFGSSDTLDLKPQCVDA